MGKIVRIGDITKGDKMYREFLRKIRNSSKELNDMEERAEDVLNQFHVSDFSKGVPIVEILTKLDFQIYQSDLVPKGLSAYIAVDPEYKDIFGSNKITCVHIGDNVGRKRFALAHELGHYLFDFDDEKNVCYYNTYFPQREKDKAEEKRADRFAASLLMPKKEFLREYEKLKDKYGKADLVSALGRYFVVPVAAIRKRFEELGINGFEG